MSAMEKQLHILEKQQLHLIDINPVASALLKRGRHVYCNDAYAALLGYPDRKKLLGRFLADILMANNHESLSSNLAGNQVPVNLEKVQAGTGSKAVLLNMSFSPAIFRSEACIQVTAQPAAGNQDHEEQKQLREQQDLLTRLNNAGHFKSRLESAIISALQDSVISVLIIVRIDDFRKLQETLGKAATNIILNDIGEFLKTSLQKPFAAARLAENEFGLLVYDTKPPKARKLMEFLSSRLSAILNGNELGKIVQVIMGLAIINNRSLDTEDAIYKARLNTNLMSPLENSNGALVKKVITENRINLLFDPLVSFDGTAQQRYRINWEIVQENPAEIDNKYLKESLLEQASLYNLTEEVDKYVFLKFAENRALLSKDRQFFIQVSNNTLVNLNFLTWLSDLLGKYKIPASGLVIQISEKCLYHNQAISLEFCRGLKELGLCLSIGQFGSCLDPLPVLNNLSPDYVNLDEHSFKELLYSRHQQQVLKKLVEAVHQKSAVVLATEIDELELLPLLWQLGIDIVEGSCIHSSSPLPDFVFPREISL